MDMQNAIKRVIEQQHLSTDEMTTVMQIIMTGQATEAQIGGFLIGLRMKGESIDEITGAAKVMRELATAVPTVSDNLVDTCGTGGTGSNKFNISTASAFVAAAAGAHVAKHGNRGVSSKSGSADLLMAAGVNLDISPDQVGKCIDDVGVGFMFAPKHHSAMKYAIGPRKEMAVRTIFNVLGPLTNPAAAPNQVTGVFDRRLLRPIAEVLQKLGSRHVMVVHSADGLDEISIATETYVAELKDNVIEEYSITPDQFGLKRGELQDLVVNDPEQSLAMVQQVLGNDQANQAASDIVALNAGAAIYVSGICQTFPLGIHMAQDMIASGQAKEKITELVNTTACFKAE